SSDFSARHVTTAVVRAYQSALSSYTPGDDSERSFFQTLNVPKVNDGNTRIPCWVHPDRTTTTFCECSINQSLGPRRNAHSQVLKPTRALLRHGNAVCGIPPAGTKLGMLKQRSP
ncbi:unnamed protein product, partial [Ectocarpus sp. 8 AP-2014]